MATLLRKAPAEVLPPQMGKRWNIRSSPKSEYRLVINAFVLLSDVKPLYRRPHIQAGTIFYTMIHMERCNIGIGRPLHQKQLFKKDLNQTKEL